jgi:outer membrane receptor protein involved in Fe transport
VGGVDYGTIDLSDRPVGFYSKHNAGLSAVWTLPISGDRGDVSLRADAAYHSEWLTDNSVAGLLATPPSATAVPGIVGYTMVPQDAYTITNLRAAWTNVWGGPVDLGLFVTNVTDEEILLGGTPVNGMVASSMAPPRMYGVEVSYRFGGTN